jgi:hypothetical protein
MEDSQYFQGIVADAIRDNIRRSRNYQFASTRHPTWPTHGGMLSEPFDRPANSSYDSTRRCWTVAGNVLSFSVEISGRLA